MGKSTFSYDKFDYSKPLTNPKIKILTDETNEVKKELKRIQLILEEKKAKLLEIQSDCDHEYFFLSSGPYEDYYRCKHCGHEKDR
jgi:hypothetical protein